MKLKTLSSGSHGNCHLLISETGETLILDCGIDIKKIKQGLNFNLSGVAGCVVSHGHQDHCKATKDLERIGIQTFKPYKTEKPQLFPGDFIIQSFDLSDKNGNFCHTNADGSECPCYGFLIKHPEIGNFLYITDTEYVKWRFKDINHILLGVNYDSDLMDCENTKRNHVLRGHMSIDTACRFVGANDNENLKTVTMCHLSKDNAEPEVFIERMQNTVPVAYVSVADVGTEVYLK